MLATKKLETSEILQELIQIKEITVAELARRINLPQPTIQRIASGTYKNPRISTLQPIADYFEITINQLRGFEPISYLSVNKKIIKSIPLLQSSQVTKWPNIKEAINQYVIYDSTLGDVSFAMHMPDPSMEPLIPKGSTLLIEPFRIPHHKSFIVIKMPTHPEVIVRQLITDATKRYIKPLSPDLGHLKMHQLNNNDTIIGVIVEIRLNCE